MGTNPLVRLLGSVVAAYLCRRGDKQRGYPRLAAFMESGDDFKIYLQFGILHTRVLLYRQYELARLEEKPQEKDEEIDANEGSSRPGHYSFSRLDACEESAN